MRKLSSRISHWQFFIVYTTQNFLFKRPLFKSYVFYLWVLIVCFLCLFAYYIDSSYRFLEEPQVPTNCKPSYNHSYNLSQLNRDAHFDRPSNSSFSLCTLAQAASTVSPSPTDSAENAQCLKETGTQTPLCARRLRLGTTPLPSRVINYFCRCNSASQRNNQVTSHTAEPQLLLSNSLEFSRNETSESVSKRKRPNETEDEPTQTAPIIPDVISACGCASSRDVQTPQSVHNSAPAGCCAHTSNGNAAQSPRNVQVGGGCCGGESTGCCAPNQTKSNTSARDAPSVASVSTRGTSSLNIVYLGSGATSKTSASNGGTKCPCGNGACCASHARPLQLPAGGDGDSDDSSADADADADADSDADVDAGADSDADAVGHSDADSKRIPPAREREREHTHERRASTISSTSSAHQSRRSHVFKRYRRPQILICQCGSASTSVTQQVASSLANADEAQAFHDANSPAVPFSAAASLSAANRAATPKSPNPPTAPTPRAGSAHTSFVIPLTPHAPSSAPPASPALAAPALSHSAHAAQSVASGALDVDVVVPAAPSQKAVAGVGVVGAGGGTTVEATIGGSDRTIHITLNSCCPPGGSGGCCGSMRERELNGHEGAEAKPSTSAKVLNNLWLCLWTLLLFSWHSIRALNTVNTLHSFNKCSTINNF